MKVFIETLQRCGVQLAFSDEQNLLTQEQSLVVRDLEKLLKNESQAINLTEFMNGFKTLCSKDKYFRKALLHTHFKKNTESNDSQLKIEQESLVRIILTVECLQLEAMNILMEHVTNIASEEGQDTSWLRLLLQPLRHLPFLKDPEVLTTKLLDILDVSMYAAQLEILDSIAEILPDSQSNEISKQLCKLLDENDSLAGAIIDCLNALHLESDIRVEVNEKILAKILSGTSLKIFPILIEFLLSDHKLTNTNLVGTIQKIRNALDTIMLASAKAEEESVQVLIFTKLQTFAATSKATTEAWLTTISSIKSHTDHKPIDLLILFMLHATGKQKKGIIEGIIRKRVKDNLFKAALLEKMFEKSMKEQLLVNYFQTMLEIGCNLMRTMNEPKITIFGTILFKTLFRHRFTSVIYKKELLDCLILLTGANDHKNAGPILSIFSDLLQNISEMQQHTLLLMRLLEQCDSFDVADVKEVFEILCALTCGEAADEGMSGLRDEVHMIIRKQLSSSKKIIKHRGIISAVVMAKYMAITTEEQSEISITEDSIMCISNLPNGPAREAASLLELTSLCTSGCPQLMGLYFDQLAYMLITTKNLNKYFMSWLYETMTNDFQNVFVTEKVMENVNGLKFSMQYSLNSEDEMETPIAVNIAGLTVRLEDEESRSIRILAPHFRLVRLLHFRQQNGDLSSIDALLGCAVVMPELGDIEMLDMDQVKLVADCIFHCINWFREIISGFVTQKSKKLRNKVVNRLLHVIELQKKLILCMESIPDHKLPASYFDRLSQSVKQAVASPKKEKRPRKKIKSAETVENDDVTASTSAVNAINKKQSSSKRHKATCQYNISYRDMDTDILILLKYPLKKDNVQDTQTPLPTQLIFIDMEQLEFILKDFVGKLAILTKGKSLGLSHLNMVIPTDIITDCIVILSNINKHILVICEKIDNILEAVNGKLDSVDLCSPRVTLMKNCFGFIIESYSLIFTWSGFQQSKHTDLLRQILQSVMRSELSQNSSANKLIIECINKLSTYVRQCIHLDYAINLVKTMQSLYSLMTTSNNDVQKKIITVCGKLLSKKWYNLTGSLESGKNYSANLDILIKIYLDGASIRTLSGLIGTLQEQAPHIKSKGCLQMLPSVDTSNFYIIFRGLCNALHNRIKLEIQALTNKEHLTLWRTTASSMQGLMTIAKAQETKNNLVCFLKKSIGILKIFLSHGIPILEIMLRSKPDDVVEIFKTMQTNTRFLHHLCCHSKLKKESSLIAYVPQFRLTLETLVYRVKAALVANNCSAAFWMGNLRNRDLQGDDILSQNSTISNNTEHENSDEELPEDDSDNDILNDDTHGEKSESMDYS